MINEKELLLSNDSPIKKDFYQIYPEILDIATKISKRWDPASSNESDPGVVLLKLLAFIGDKNNYISDKSIKEAYMPSCTQEDSMRKLCEMMGYEMSYYKSATVNVTFTYLKDLPEDTFFTLEPFETTLTNADGDVNYVLLDSVVISEKNKPIVGKCIEGTLCYCKSGDNDKIKIYNLDDNHRFYLPETQIAENGIWVSNYEGNATVNDWAKVDNLNNQLDNSYVWKFGFDSSKNLPYIEFPEDVAQLIGDGLEIKYVRTTGANGNISAHELTNLSSSTTLKLSNGEEINIEDDTGLYTLDINNQSAAINGADKETLNSAYSNFKRTVGTFDTLVTCRDYANYIYRLTENDGNTPYVSNVQVSDIRDDIDSSLSIITYSEHGVCFKTVSRKEGLVQEDKIKPFDLVLYTFHPITTSYTKDTYNESFIMYFGNTSLIEADIKGAKNIAHVFKYPKNSDVSMIKNYYKLAADITTTYKVNSTEEDSILKNIYTALYKNFNMREVEFGEEIPYDVIVDVIKNADVRIKDIRLKDPILETKLVNINNSIQDEYDSSRTGFDDKFNYLVAKNVMAGRLNILDYDNDFDFELGQSNSTVYPDSSHKINRLKTTFNLPTTVINNAGGYTLKENEVIQFIAPNLKSRPTYPYSVLYNANLGSGVIIPKNTDYALGPDQYLNINYTDTDGVEHFISYGPNKKYNEYLNGNLETLDGDWSGIIRPNFDLKHSGDDTRTETKDTNNPDYIYTMASRGTPAQEYPLFSIGSNETIDIRNFIKDTINEPTYFYWFIEGQNETIPWQAIEGDSDHVEYILQEGEYFFYSKTLSDLEYFGSGTKLKISSSLANSFKNEGKEVIEAEAIEESGLGAFTSDAWYVCQFGNSTSLEIQEMQIITLTEGDNISNLTPASGTSIYSLDNNFKEIETASFTVAGKYYSNLPQITDENWKIRSRLDLNVGPDLTQKLKLYENLYAFYKTNTGSTPDVLINGGSIPVNVRTKYLLQKAGAEKIDVSVVKLNADGTEEDIDDFSLMRFSYTQPTDSTSSIPPTSDEGFITIDLAKRTSTAVPFFTSKVSVPSGETGLLMFYYNRVSDDSSKTLSLKSTENNLKEYNTSDTEDDEIELNTGVNVIAVSSSCTLTLISNDSDFKSLVKISPISIIKGLVDFGANVNTGDILSKIATLDSEHTYFYNHPIDNSILINEPLTIEGELNPLFWYDTNNIVNKFTISQLNTASIMNNIKITKGSKL